MRRPDTLAEAVGIAAGDRSRYWTSLDEFLDTFYLDHGDLDAQSERIDAAPAFLGDPLLDAWTGAVGEHLADRWLLPTPYWTGRSGHFRLVRPEFFPATPSLARMLVSASPPAFRARRIYTVSEPLQRARFPHEARRHAPARVRAYA